VSGLDEVARWSPWLPFADAVSCAPLTPGVYVVRLGVAGPVVYVGMAGERHGRGLRGRLSVYASGKAAISGLGEAAFNRALADPDWLRDRVAELDAGQPRTAKQWASAAIEHWDLWVCWTTTADRVEASNVELRALAGLGSNQMLWNVRRS
jgi:hypothetical protein